MSGPARGDPRKLARAALALLVGFPLLAIAGVAAFSWVAAFLSERADLAKPLVVALLDTGLDPARVPAPKLLPGRNLWDGNADTRDEDGHGTSMALAILERCEECRLLPVKITKHGAGIRAQDVAAAIRFAAESGAKVANLSFGTSPGSPELEKEVLAASGQGMILVAAAGEGFPNPYKPARLAEVYPHAYPQAIVVGRLVGGAADERMNFGDELDFVLPSAESGTSEAAARVSALVARLVRGHRAWGVAEARYILREAAQPVLAADASRTGHGVLSDEQAALRLAPRELGRRLAVIQGAVELGLNSVAPLKSASAGWICPGIADLVMSKPLQGAFAKGRARIRLQPPSALNCHVKVEVTLADGQERVLDEPAPR